MLFTFSLPCGGMVRQASHWQKTDKHSLQEPAAPASVSPVVRLLEAIKNWKAAEFGRAGRKPRGRVCLVMVKRWNRISWRFFVRRRNCSVSAPKLAWFKRPKFSFSTLQISGKDHQSQCPQMLRYWHQQMQLVVYLAQTVTLVVQSCHRYPQVWKGALQKLVAWVQDLIKLGQGAQCYKCQRSGSDPQSPQSPLAETIKP